MEKQGMQKLNEKYYVDKSKVLGQGNFGIVYKGFETTQNKIVAVKFTNKGKLKQFPDYKRQLLVMDDLSKLHHPNIMGYYGFQQNNDGLYCFIEFCNGGALKDLIKKKISQFKVMTLFKQLLQAMTYINKMNKVHRDLKPDNILLDQNEELKVADFGLARDVEVMMTKGTGTPLYAAPEVINLKPYNQKCDVWSAGLILYEMLVGRQYFQHVKTKKQLLSQLERFNTKDFKLNLPSSLHKEWQKITLSMLTYNPANRLSFQQVLDNFKSVEGKMMKDLSDKYGYEMPGFENFDDGLTLTKTISPYQAKPTGNRKQDMLKKLTQERSFTNANNLRKFLAYFRHKNEFMNRLIKQFTNNTYPCVKNVYKYMMMYLSVAGFISRQLQHIQELKANKIKTPDGVLTLNDFEQIHLNQVKSLIKDYIVKHENSMTKFRSVLEKQISAKILKSYMVRDEEKKILVENRIPEMIQKSDSGQFDRETVYLTKFSEIMNFPSVHISDQNLNALSEPDLKVYFYIRLIGNIDKYFADENYKNDDYVHLKKQQIENMNKTDRIQNLRLINKK